MALASCAGLNLDAGLWSEVKSLVRAGLLSMEVSSQDAICIPGTCSPRLIWCTVWQGGFYTLDARRWWM